MKYILLVVFGVFLTGCAWKSDLVNTQNMLYQTQDDLNKANTALGKTQAELHFERARADANEVTLNQERQQKAKVQEKMNELILAPKEIPLYDESGNKVGSLEESH